MMQSSQHLMQSVIPPIFLHALMHFLQSSIHCFITEEEEEEPRFLRVEGIIYITKIFLQQLKVD